MTRRAAGFRPNDTLDTPSTVLTPGSSVLICRMASSVIIAVLAQVVATRGQREGQGIEDQVLGSQAITFTARSWMRWAIRSFHSRVRACPSSSMRRQMTPAPCLWPARKPGRDASPAFAVLEVGAVEQTAAAEPFQTGLHDLGLGRVEHDGGGNIGGEGSGQLQHVGHAVPPDIIDTEVDEMGPLLT